MIGVFVVRMGLKVDPRIMRIPKFLFQIFDKLFEIINSMMPLKGLALAYI